MMDERPENERRKLAAFLAAALNANAGLPDPHQLHDIADEGILWFATAVAEAMDIPTVNYTSRADALQGINAMVNQFRDAAIPSHAENDRNLTVNSSLPHVEATGDTGMYVQKRRHHPRTPATGDEARVPAKSHTSRVKERGDKDAGMRRYAIHPHKKPDDLMAGGHYQTMSLSLQRLCRYLAGWKSITAVRKENGYGHIVNDKALIQQMIEAEAARYLAVHQQASAAEAKQHVESNYLAIVVYKAARHHSVAWYDFSPEAQKEYVSRVKADGILKRGEYEAVCRRPGWKPLEQIRGINYHTRPRVIRRLEERVE